MLCVPRLGVLPRVACLTKLCSCPSPRRYTPYVGEIMTRENGSLVSFETGQVGAPAPLPSFHTLGLFCRCWWLPACHAGPGTAAVPPRTTS